MGTLAVTNISSPPETLVIREAYVQLAPGETKSLTRDASELSTMQSIIEMVSAGKASIVWTPTAAELASGLLSAPQSITHDDVAPVAASGDFSPLVVIRKSFAAGGGGAPDDVVIRAANNLPYKLRIIGGHAIIATAVGATTLSVRDQAAGAGQLAASFSSAALGHSAWTGPNATVVLTPGALVGLFVRRSDNGVAGEVVLYARRES